MAPGWDASSSFKAGLLPFGHTLSGAGDADAQSCPFRPSIRRQSVAGWLALAVGVGSRPLAQAAPLHRPLGLPRVALYNRPRSGVLIVGENRREVQAATPTASGEYSARLSVGPGPTRPPAAWAQSFWLVLYEAR
jgi:hypothetical protein